MKIITVPHRTLRTQAQPIKSLTPELLSLSKNLGKTLLEKTSPSGVGLAAPQVNQSWRMFVTHVAPDGDEDNQAKLELYINPVIVKTSPKHTFGPDPEYPILEGCLSIPLLYGAVPRWEWVEVEYQKIVDDKLVSEKVRVEGFEARVIQHEYDHLEGILFTDYVVQYDLPLYQTKKHSENLVEVDSRVALGF